MLYVDILNKYKNEAEVAVKSLFKKAKINQDHENDLLLIFVHGFYEKRNVGTGYSPYLVGPGNEGWTNQSQYDFFDQFRNSYLQESKKAHITELKENLNNWEIQYQIITQLEMLVYLKFWESDYVLKQLYNLCHQLLHGRSYDWHKNMKKSGRKDLIENQIINSCKNRAPKFYRYIKSTYNRQIRNAVAHSQFYLIGDRIGFTNYDPNDDHILKGISIEEWEDIFHRTIQLYNYLIGVGKEHHDVYKKEATKRHFGKKIRINREDGSLQYEWLVYLDEQDRWTWYKNVRG